MMNKLLKQTIGVSLALGLLSGSGMAETYSIDAQSSKMEIRSVDYRMGTSVNSKGVAIKADNNYYLSKGGEAWFPVVGEIHFSRYPRHMWEDAILRMKAGGLDVIATYCFWIHHEEANGEFDFTGQRDLRAFVELCKKHDMQVILRIGPWCHGEVRNGGFPDWVQKMKGHRSNDPTYIKYAKRIYEQYYKQVKGLLYKDDGPIIGIQLENEYAGPAAHIAKLKEMAVGIGFDVPMYTVTGWGGVGFPDKEVLPVQAGYPDAPWMRGTHQRDLNPQYLFKAGVPINTGVGADVLPVLEVYGGRKYNPSDYPWLTAELGLGICVTYNRRPFITTQDAVSLMTVKLAGGANCLGYYMYHGGTNPQGKLTTLHEARCPTMSYDFQCAVGEYGETSDKYHEMKLIHYWLQQFGGPLCSTIPALPSKQPADVKDVDVFRCMARTDGTSGYLFFSNYQRYALNKDMAPLQVAVKLKGETVTFPNKAVAIPKDANGIWPINLKMSDALLKYATAQLICKVLSGDGETYFFFSNDGITPEFSFSSDSVKSISAEGMAISKLKGQTLVTVAKPGTDAVISLESASGKMIQICTLTQKQAMNSNYFKDLWGKAHLVMADADVLSNGTSLDIRSTGKNAGELLIYPEPTNAIAHKQSALKSEKSGVFSKYHWSVPAKKFEVKLSPVASTKADGQAITNYELFIPKNALEDVYDVYVDMDWVGNHLEVRNGSKLIADFVYYGAHFRPSIKHWGSNVLGKKLKVSIEPITTDTKCYLEPEYRPDFSKKSSIAEVSQVKTLPVYRLIIK